MVDNEILSNIYRTSLNSPDLCAIRCSENSITYRELWCCIQKYSILLNEYTKGNQVPVIIYQSRHEWFVISMLVCMAVGCFYIPVVKETPVERLKKIIADSKCQIVLTDEMLVEFSGVQINVRDASVVKNVDFACETELSRKHPHLAYVMYTSGTTGEPKGVMILLSNLMNLVRSFGEILYNEIQNPVNVAVLASFGFDSSVKQIFSSLYYGHTLVIAGENEKKFSKTLQAFYAKNNIYITDGTPSNMRILTMTKKIITNQVKYFIIGGENFQTDIARQIIVKHENPVQIINVYGPTECCVDVSYYKVRLEELNGEFLPIGEPILNTRLFLVDEDLNEICEAGIKGELVISGLQVGDGYTNSDNSRFTFDNDIMKRSYRTGDVAVINEKKQMVVLGRLDNQVKKYGYRIELDEVAVGLKKVSYIEEAIVRKRNDEGIQKIVGFVVSKLEVKESDLLKELEQHIPYYMMPDIIVQIQSIALNINGKVDEQELENCFRKKQRMNSCDEVFVKGNVYKKVCDYADC